MLPVMVTISKSEVAVRQLDTAIKLLFNNGDPLSIRTLAGAAFNVLSDLADAKSKNSSWRARLISDSGMSRGEAIATLNNVQNFLKHANQDPDTALEFDEAENHDVLFVATLTCGDLNIPLSASIQAFQVWFIILYSERFTSNGQAFIAERFPGPDIKTMSTSEKLQYGNSLIEDAETLLANQQA